MYDYMKALQDRFDYQEHTELDEQVKSAQEELRRDMGAESCSACWTHRTRCWSKPS